MFSKHSSAVSLLIQFNIHAPWLIASTIHMNENHHHSSIQIPIRGHVLVHFVEKTHVLFVTVEQIWLLFLNIFFSTLFQHWSRFRRGYVNCTAVVLTNYCQSYTAFLLDVRFSKVPRFFFYAAVCPRDNEFA